MNVPQESKLKRSAGAPDAVSEPAPSSLSALPVVEESIAMHVYGVDQPGAEITHQLVEVLQNRIDEAALDIIAELFRRNAKLKLTYADVRVSLTSAVTSVARMRSRV